MVEEIKEQAQEEEVTLSSQVDDTVQETQEDNQVNQREMSEEEINWKKKREKDRKDKEESARREQEKDVQIRAYKDALEEVVNAKNGASLTQKEQEQVIYDLEDEDIPTGSEIKKFLERKVPDIISGILEKRSEEKKAKKQATENERIPQKLQAEYKDFNETLDKDNLDYLEYHYPEVSASLVEMPHSFEKWSRIYKTVKKLVPGNKDSDVRRIEKNTAKPQSITNARSQQSSEQGFGRTLTEAQKTENYRRMRELANGS